jgi:hypothetical protein
MRLVRFLQHGLSGTGTPLHVTDVVPETPPRRQWAAPLPWAALVSAIAQSFATRCPTTSQRGRRPVPLRVLCALELLKHALGASEEDSGPRLRTAFALMYACGLRAYQVNPSQAHVGLPETLCALRSRIDEALMEARIAIQAAAAMEEGLVRPAPLVIETLPRAQGSQRVTAATPLYKAPKPPSSSSPTSPSRAAPAPPRSRAKREACRRHAKRSCGVSAAAGEAKGASA